MPLPYLALGVRNAAGQGETLEAVSFTRDNLTTKRQPRAPVVFRLNGAA